ncbi:hypothetical protein PRNP1_004871 [Phytophthora ramorum]
MKLLLLLALTLSCLFAADEAEEITTAPITTTTAPTTSPSATTAASTGLTCGTQLKNIYYHGLNLQTLTASDAAACCDLCSAYDGCVLYTYFHSSSTGQSLCYLKSGAGEKTNYADSSSVTAVSAIMVSTTSAPTPTATNPTTVTPPVCSEKLDGVFYSDYTIYEFSTDSADQCCEYCSQLAGKGCVLYTLYVSKSDGVQRCLLKSAAGTTTNYTNSDDLTVVSAFLPASEIPTPTPTTECTVAEGGISSSCLVLHTWLASSGAPGWSPAAYSLLHTSSYASCGASVTDAHNRTGQLDKRNVMAPKGAPFQALNLTLDEEQHCRDRSFQLLDRTLRSYDERDGQEDNGQPSVPLHHSNLDSTRWKQLKTQTSASLYVERSSSVHRDDNILGGDWKNPMVFLMVGTIHGNLDEVMLGVETPIIASLRDRKEVLAMQPVDCAVLAELAGPTEADPFQYRGIQWMFFQHGWPLKAVSSPRDFVTLASKGTMTRANGDRIGYQVVQPAKLPQCPPLPGSIRTNLMYAAIFKQQAPGIVDVFVQTYIETLSTLLNKVVVSATWKSTLDLWLAPQFAEMKKLQWCLANCKAQRRQLQRQASPSAKNVCKQCMEKRKMRGSDVEDKTSCVLCVSPTCSTCRVERTLEAIDERRLKMTDQVVIVCQACMVFVQHMRPVDIVRQSLAP